MSIFEQLHVKYKSRERDETSSEIKTTIVYMGSRDICEQALDSDFKVGQSYQDLGTLENVKFSQDEGPIWNLTCSYSISLNSGTHAKGTKAGTDDSVLEIRMLGLPLEVHANYRKCWNNNLYTTNVAAISGYIPTTQYMDTWNDATAQDDAIPNSQKFDPNADADTLKQNTYLAWGKHITDCPSLPNGVTWFELKKMTKPRSGVFQLSCL